MSVQEIGQKIERRIANLMNLRTRLMDQMAWKCSQRKRGQRCALDRWREWLQSAVLNRQHMSVARQVMTKQNHSVARIARWSVGSSARNNSMVPGVLKEVMKIITKQKKCCRKICFGSSEIRA